MALIPGHNFITLTVYQKNLYNIDPICNKILITLTPGGIRRHGHPRFVKGGGRRRNDRSSAMSDTSEAPSVASHVRRVRVPSQASDVDQVKLETLYCNQFYAKCF